MQTAADPNPADDVEGLSDAAQSVVQLVFSDSEGEFETCGQAMMSIPFAVGETIELDSPPLSSGLFTGGTGSPDEIFLSNFGGDPNIILGQTSGGDLIFIVYLDDTTGEVWFIQFDEVNHPLAGDGTGGTFDEPVTFDLSFTTTGPGGSTSTTLTIEVQDDGPVADIDPVGEAMVVLDETIGGEGAFDDDVSGNPFPAGFGVPIGLSSADLADIGTNTDVGKDEDGSTTAFSLSVDSLSSEGLRYFLCAAS